jgi:hypothetical protein
MHEEVNLWLHFKKNKPSYQTSRNCRQTFNAPVSNFSNSETVYGSGYKTVLHGFLGIRDLFPGYPRIHI